MAVTLLARKLLAAVGFAMALLLIVYNAELGAFESSFEEDEAAERPSPTPLGPAADHPDHPAEPGPQGPPATGPQAPPATEPRTPAAGLAEPVTVLRDRYLSWPEGPTNGRTFAGRLEHVVAKAMRGETIRIAVFGGSVSTEAHYTASHYYHWLKFWFLEMFPQCSVELSALARPGMPSQYTVSGLDSIHPETDLVIMEFMLNDAGSGMCSIDRLETVEQKRKGLDPSLKVVERVARSLLTKFEQPIAMLYVGEPLFAHVPFTDVIFDTYRTVFARYQIPLLWLHRYFAEIQEPPFSRPGLFKTTGSHPHFDGHALQGMLLRSMMSAAYRNVLSNNGVAPALNLKDPIGDAMFSDNDEVEIGKPPPHACTQTLLDRPMTLELLPRSNGFELSEFLTVDITKYAFVANDPGSNAYVELKCKEVFAEAYLTFYFQKNMGAVTVYRGKGMDRKAVTFGDACRDDSFPTHYVDVKVPLSFKKIGQDMQGLRIETRVPDCPDLHNAAPVQLVSVSTAQQSVLWEGDVVIWK